MAMPQRDDLIEEFNKTERLLEYAIAHGEQAEAERLRAKNVRNVISSPECH